MPRHPVTDAALIQQLHELVFENGKFRSAVETAFVRARDELDLEGNALPYSSVEIPPTVFKSKLTESLRGRVNLCRVFILRKGQRMETPEIHRNSIQRLASYRGHGTIHSAEPGGDHMVFRPYALGDFERSAVIDLNQLWDVVPMNTWHFPEASAESDWYTVTFHSASSTDIVDEYITTP